MTREMNLREGGRSVHRVSFPKHETPRTKEEFIPQ